MITDVRIDALTTGNTSSCGCMAKEIRRNSALRLTSRQSGENHPRFIDMSGQVYGRLTVIEYIADKKKWRCKCTCGNGHLVARDYLVSGGSRSCGCLAIETHSGKNNNRWNSSLTEEDRKKGRFTKRYRSFILDIFKRDDYRCRICNIRGVINIHHLNNFADYPDQRFERENSITLCEDHHKEFHSWMGGTIYPCVKSDFYSWLKEANQELCYTTQQ